MSARFDGDPLQFFSFAHLPAPLKGVSQQFFELAANMEETLPRNPETDAMFRKLLEAKDCAVRALIYR